MNCLFLLSLEGIVADKQRTARIQRRQEKHEEWRLQHEASDSASTPMPSDDESASEWLLKEWYGRNIVVDKKGADALFEATVEQGASPMWRAARCIRVTASNAKRIARCRFSTNPGRLLSSPYSFFLLYFAHCY